MLSKTSVRWGTIVTTLSDSFKGNPRQTFKLSINCMASKICLSNDILLNSCSTLHSCNLWFQKISIPPPPTEGIGFSMGEGGVNFPNFPVGRGVTRGKYFQRVLVTRLRVTKKKQKFTWTIYLRTYKT